MHANWCDIVLNEMANKAEERRREAEFLLKAGYLLPAAPKRPFAGIAHSIRQYIARSRAANHIDPNLNVDTCQESAV